jgi:tetratricopeptide (TPR) repeat protein
MESGGIDAMLAKYKELKQNKGKKYFFFEREINTWGYALLGENKLNEAIEVFKINTEMFPNSSNVYDSLAEAYMNAGNKQLTIKNYEKSLELNPQNTNAFEQLNKLNADK